MRTPVDLIGKRFGKLLVVKYDHSDGNDLHWECLCDCGKTKISKSPNLKSGNTRSCGCLRTIGINVLPQNGHCKNVIWNIFSQRSKKRKWNFDLTKEQVTELVAKPCYYCDLKASNYVKKKYGELYYNGLDRIDNTKGYSIDNVLTACKHCNALRMDVLTVDETKAVIDFIKNKRGITCSPWEGFKRIKRK